MSTLDVINALLHFETYFHHFPTYTFKTHLDCIHSDCGSQLISKELSSWALTQKAQTSSGAPGHQEHNGLSERTWQELQKISRCLENEARLGPAFHDLSLKHATKIHAMRPIKNLTLPLSSSSNSSEVCQSCPFEKYYNKLPTIHRFRVFGCPAIFKLFTRTCSETKQVLTTKNCPQRGV